MGARTKKPADKRSSAFTANRQAVVVIHGIGNQRPMDTLRPFVDAVLGVDPTHDDDPLYYSKPDDMSDTFELRRLQSKDSRPRTDYFELYWQHLVPTPPWRRIRAWLVLLLGRRPADVPPALRSVWLGSWIVFAVILALLVLTVVLWLYPGAVPVPDGLQKSVSVPLGLAVLLGAAQAAVLDYVGDAAVYLSPDPANIKARQAVRDAGVALIERLHGGADAARTYDRIVIVGHSLGSVIGYDILTHAWPRFNDRRGQPVRPVNEAMAQAKLAARRLAEAQTDADVDAATRLRARTQWLLASRALWLEQRGNQFAWLVTDFITLGSPLSHGLLLLARNRREFERKKAQRELPTCPPWQQGGRDFSYPMQYDIDAQTRRTVIGLDHAALFAVTRWTNLYFPARFGLKGDLVGGPVAPVFGPGVLDVPVRTARLGGWLSHTRYWQTHPKDRIDDQSAIRCLTVALDIGRKSFSPAPPSNQDGADGATGRSR